jgi:signal transduction histidine kinase
VGDIRPDSDNRILVVDDNPDNITLIEQLLELAGHANVKSLTDSSFVIDTVFEWEPDLILLDLHMPGQSGYDILQSLRSLLPSDSFLPILIFTADQTMAARMRALDLGASDFITKPYEATEVLLRVRNFLRMRGMHLELQSRNAALSASEESARRLAEELQLANHELHGFTYSVSHDLRGPLRAIMSTSQILLEECGEALDDEHVKMLERQVFNAKRLATIIDELLKLARVSRVEMAFTQLDLSTIALDVIEEVRETFPSLDLQFRVEPNLTAVGDQLLVRLLLLNLIGNAAKFSPQGGELILSRNERAFYITDAGIGFDMAHATRMFEPFERLVSDTDFPGTGIGLANVKRIVERHGGEVWAESEPGKGATFFFTLRS